MTDEKQPRCDLVRTAGAAIGKALLMARHGGLSAAEEQLQEAFTLGERNLPQGGRLALPANFNADDEATATLLDAAHRLADEMGNAAMNEVFEVEVDEHHHINPYALAGVPDFGFCLPTTAELIPPPPAAGKEDDEPLDFDPMEGVRKILRC